MEEEIRPKRKLKVKGEDLWLTTFSDMSFLLLCFFVLLLSFSTMNKQKFDNVADGMAAKTPIKDPVVVQEQKTNLKTLSKAILDEIKRLKLRATVIYDADGIAVEFDEKLFFTSGSAQLGPEYRPMTAKLMQIIAKSPKHYKVIVEGHTDDVPVGEKAKFASNWELSAARGVAMLAELKRLGADETRMTVSAYAHTRPKVAIADKSRAELAQARAANRRVVIRIQ